MAGGEFLEGEGWGKGAGEAFGEAVDGGEEALEKGGDGPGAAEGFGADAQAIAEAVVAGAGGVDDPLDGAGTDEVESIGAAFAEAEAGGGGEARAVAVPRVAQRA